MLHSSTIPGLFITRNLRLWTSGIPHIYRSIYFMLKKRLSCWHIPLIYLPQNQLLLCSLGGNTRITCHFSTFNVPLNFGNENKIDYKLLLSTHLTNVVWSDCKLLTFPDHPLERDIGLAQCKDSSVDILNANKRLALSNQLQRE